MPMLLAHRASAPRDMWPDDRSIWSSSWYASPYSLAKHWMTKSHCTRNLAQFHQPEVRSLSLVLSCLVCLLPYSKRTRPIWRRWPSTGLGTSNQAWSLLNLSRMGLRFSHSSLLTWMPKPRSFSSLTNALTMTPLPGFLGRSWRSPSIVHSLFDSRLHQNTASSWPQCLIGRWQRQVVSRWCGQLATPSSLQASGNVEKSKRVPSSIPWSAARRRSACTKVPSSPSTHSGMRCSNSVIRLLYSRSSSTTSPSLRRSVKPFTCVP